MKCLRPPSRLEWSHPYQAIPPAYGRFIGLEAIEVILWARLLEAVG